MNVWQSRLQSRLRVHLALGSLASAFLLGAILRSHHDNGPASYAAEQPVATVQQQAQPETALNLSDSFRAVAKSLRPSVVSITSVKSIHQSENRQRFQQFDNPQLPEQLREFFGDDGLDRFFQFSVPQESYQQQGLGSGVLISEDGYLLSNNHVVRNADKITVILSDERQFQAEMIGSDAATDLAVLKIDATGLTPARLGDSSALAVGDWVLAMGSPMGLEQTVTAGIISATGRANVGIADYEDFLQTDAAINPGNSGGPLVNIHGEVVGINTAIASRTGGNMGIGFAIPSNMAKSVQNAILNEGGVKRGRLGVLIQDLTPDLAASFDYKSTNGVLVGDVVPNGPADEAGLEAGDIIVKYGDQPVRKAYELRNAVAATAPQSQVTLKIVRNGQTQNIDATVSELEQAATSSSLSSDDSSPRRLGLTVRPLTQEIRAQLQLESRVNGVVVTQIQPGSVAQREGIEVGDVILSINGRPITTPDDFRSAVTDSNTQGLRLQLLRNGVRRFVFLRSEE